MSYRPLVLRQKYSNFWDIKKDLNTKKDNLDVRKYMEIFTIVNRTFMQTDIFMNITKAIKLESRENCYEGERWEIART